MLYGAKTCQNTGNEKQQSIVHRLLLLQHLNAGSGGPQIVCGLGKLAVSLSHSALNSTKNSPGAGVRFARAPGRDSEAVRLAFWLLAFGAWPVSRPELRLAGGKREV